METNLPEKRQKTVFDALMELKPQIAMALPKHITADRMLRVAITALRKTPKLQQCNQLSLFGSILTCAQLGLETNDPRGLAYLVPYGQECQVIIGYRGLIDLAMRSGMVENISGHPVFERDLFEFEYGFEAKLRHVPYNGDEDPGLLKCAYAVATLKGGSKQFVVVSKHGIEKARMSSQSGKKNEGPWKDWLPEMATKTAIRRLAKFIPQSIEFAYAIEVDEAKISLNPATMEVDVTPVDVTPETNSRNENTPTLSDKLAEKVSEISPKEAAPTVPKPPAPKAESPNRYVPKAETIESLLELKRLSVDAYNKVLKNYRIAGPHGIQNEEMDNNINKDAESEIIALGRK